MPSSIPRFVRPLSFAVLAAVLYVGGFAGFDLWPLCFLFPLPLFALLRDGKLTFLGCVGAGLLCGTLATAGGYYFLEAVLIDFFELSPITAFFIYLAFCLYHGGQIALGFVLIWRARQARLPWLRLAAPLWIAAELLYPMLFPTFLGYGLHDLVWPRQVVDLGGPLLLSALVVATSAAVFDLVDATLGRRPVDRLLGGGVLVAWALTLFYGAYRVDEQDARVAAAPKLEVGVVQIDMPATYKIGDIPERLRRLHRQTARLQRLARPDLVVWSETVVGSLSDAQRIRGPVTTPLIFGAIVDAPSGEGSPYNSAVLFDATGQALGRYDKIYRLAFAEYIPGADRFPELQRWLPRGGRFARGEGLDPLVLDGVRISALICYEDVLPGFVRDVVAEAQPHLLINLTNDVWFGDTVEPWTHLAMAKLRAIEHRRFLVRSTNSGVSAFIDPVGRIVAKAPTFSTENLHASVALLEGRTIYGRLGDWPGLLALLTLPWLLRRRR